MFWKLSLFVLLSINFPNPISSDLISSSKIEKCYASTTANSSTLMDCDKKFVLSISLDNNELQGSNSIIAYLTTTTDANNKDINYILKTPIQIQMSKSKVYAMYPLTYLQDFNNKPMENVQSSSLLDCQDGDYDKKPTCGFQYDSKDQKILYSQGYCCECSFLDTLGLDNSKLSRGNICKALNIGSGSASAHCLQMDNLWYSGFEIGTPQIYYSITIYVDFLTPQNIGNNTVDVSNDNNPSGSPFYSSSIRIGSFKNAGFDQNKTVLAKIIGDFYPNKAPVSLSNYYMMKPSRPSNDPRVLQGMSKWMFIAKEAVTLDGSQCDKIGVSYEAFQNQGNKCGMIIGSCLKNQLEDFNAEDLKRINKGLNPRYLLTSQGEFQASQNLDQISLLLGVSGSFATLLTLEIKADSIQYITNLGQGIIDYVKISNFEAFSNNGNMNIMITNTGQLTAEFDLFFDCDSTINPLSFQKFFLNALESKIMNIALSTSDVNDKNHTCEVFLKDAIGQTLDTEIVNFTTTRINYTSAQNTSQNNLTTGISQPIKQDVNCDDICPDFYNFLCSIANSCSGNILKFVFFIIGLLITFSCCGFLIKRNPTCLCSIFSWLFKKKEESTNNSKKEIKKPNPEDKKKKRKRAQSVLQNSYSIDPSSEDSYYYDDPESQKRKIQSHVIKKDQIKNNKQMVIIHKEKSQRIRKKHQQNAEIYCFNQQNKSFIKDNDYSKDITDFDSNYEREMNSKSEFCEPKTEFPPNLLKDNHMKKAFVNINKKHQCWIEFEFPMSFSFAVYLFSPKKQPNIIENSLVLLPKNSALKYLIQSFYDNQTEIVLSELLRIALGNMIFLTKHPIYKILTKEEVDLNIN